MTDEVAVELASRLLTGTKYTIVTIERSEKLADMEKSQAPWNLKEFAKWCKHSPQWIKENILYIPAIKKQMDKASGGWVTYSLGNGSPWRFPVEQTKKFVLENGLLN